MELRTDRLLLRPPDLQRDLEDVVAGAADPHVPRFIVMMPSPYGIEETFVIRDKTSHWLKREARGRGVMTEAVLAVVAWAQDDHAITYLVLTTDPANIASQRVAERAGFSRVGVAEHDPPLADGRTESVFFERRTHALGV